MFVDELKISWVNLSKCLRIFHRALKCTKSLPVYPWSVWWTMALICLFLWYPDLQLKSKLPISITGWMDQLISVAGAILTGNLDQLIQVFNSIWPLHADDNHDHKNIIRRFFFSLSYVKTTNPIRLKFGTHLVYYVINTIGYSFLWKRTK